jgi:putative membrane protein
MNNSISSFIKTAIKGAAMGAANVIPGVSGGTIALITGIFERLINAIKSFNGQAIKLLLKRDFKALAEHIDLYFLIALFTGVGTAVLSLAKLFDYLFINYPIYIWAFFFGLVLASVYFVGKTVKSWPVSVIISLLAGTAIAISFTVLTPASQNDSFLYLMLCGVVAICSMILPGLSGSFVLILLGNYQLVMIDAINNLSIQILLPVAIGAGGGLIAFSHFLSWLLKKYHNQTIALLTGFIAGSLGILWPWKIEVTKQFGEKIKTVGFDYYQPELNSEFYFAVLFIILGIASITITELLATKKK